jgi:lauroyl/myristoyl acyltransferase
MNQGRPSRARRSSILALVRQASRLPRGLAEGALRAAGLVAAVAEPKRVALSYAWSRAHADTVGARTRITLGVLAHRGGVFADSWAPAFEQPAALRARVTLVGREHLDALSGRAAILLGFHLGTPLVRWTLIANGYDSLIADDPQWHFVGHARPGWLDHERTRVPVGLEADETPDRAVAVHRLRLALRAGRLVRMMADGDVGRELVRLPVADRTLIVRAGWWHLWRSTAAVVIPVLAHGRGPNAVVTIHEPLPSLTVDEPADLRRATGRLTMIVNEFVSTHPNQCLPWRLAPARQPDASVSVVSEHHHGP